jgi:hypothetical protein
MYLFFDLKVLLFLLAVILCGFLFESTHRVSQGWFLYYWSVFYVAWHLCGVLNSPQGELFLRVLAKDSLLGVILSKFGRRTFITDILLTLDAINGSSEGV